jgi:hypothetical protein
LSGHSSIAFLMVLLGLLLILAGGARAGDAGGDIRALIRSQATEFCSVVKKPPQALAEALSQSVQQDPQKWLPVVQWFNRIAERYHKNGCNET